MLIDIRQWRNSRISLARTIRLARIRLGQPTY
jgi:hypothetical protein